MPPASPGTPPVAPPGDFRVRTPTRPTRRRRPTLLHRCHLSHRSSHHLTGDAAGITPSRPAPPRQRRGGSKPRTERAAERPVPTRPWSHRAFVHRSPAIGIGDPAGISASRGSAHERQRPHASDRPVMPAASPSGSTRRAGSPCTTAPQPSNSSKAHAPPTSSTPHPWSESTTSAAEDNASPQHQWTNSSTPWPTSPRTSPRYLFDRPQPGTARSPGSV